MKYLLTPITMVLWYLVAYFSIYLVVLGILFSFSLHWFLLFLGYTFLISLVYFFTVGLPGMLNMLILKLYGFNMVLIILHVLAGGFGLFRIFRYFITMPPELVMDGKSIHFLSAMWQMSPFKTILLALPFIALIIGVIYSTIIAPFMIDRDKINS